VASDNQQIASILAQRSRPLAKVINVIGPPPSRRPIPVPQRFERLATAILHQQLAGAAAATITQRVITMLGGRITPEALGRASDEQLRSCGVSGAKSAALQDLAHRAQHGHLRFDRMGRMDDQDVLDSLVDTKGIGTWTAQMFLMGALGRHDVWPTGDLGVRNGWAAIHHLDQAPTPKALDGLADHLAPYRSDVAWYCWRAIDLQRQGTLPR
jgi:DNA-3-methyladenine glycosylase II